MFITSPCSTLIDKLWPICRNNRLTLTSDTGVTDPTDFQGGENSDEQLQKDDNEAIDKSNIIGERTRGGKPSKGAMAEPGDEEVSRGGFPAATRKLLMHSRVSQVRTMAQAVLVLERNMLASKAKVDG